MTTTPIPNHLLSRKLFKTHTFTRWTINLSSPNNPRVTLPKWHYVHFRDEVHSTDPSKGGSGAVQGYLAHKKPVLGQPYGPMLRPTVGS